jgi:drug/metabolite transporter superfamily protein YnfA
MQAKRPYLPDVDRLGVLVASVLLTYALTRLIQSPRFTLTLSLPGFYFALPLTLSTAMTLLAAGLTATGMDWLVHGHPSLGRKGTIEHLLLPTLTTFIIGVPLALLPDDGTWWVGFGIGASLLVSLFLAEYIVVELSAPYYALARAGLTAVSYALFLILLTALRFSSGRLFILVPAVFITAGLISLRILHLDGTDRWDFPWAIGIGLICAQVSAGLHFWPLTPIQFGLALTGPLYALSTLSINLAEDIPLRRAALGPGLIVGCAWVAVAFLR